MKKYNIKVIVKAWNSDFWQTMLSGAKLQWWKCRIG